MVSFGAVILEPFLDCELFYLFLVVASQSIDNAIVPSMADFAQLILFGCNVNLCCTYCFGTCPGGKDRLPITIDLLTTTDLGHLPGTLDLLGSTEILDLPGSTYRYP